MSNQACGIAINGSASFYYLNDKCAHYSFTVITLSLLAGLSIILAFIIYIKYSSIRILNYHVYISAISNNWWLVYFSMVATRAIVLAIQYRYKEYHPAFFITNWILGSVEILVMCYALNYQRKFRSIDQIYKETDAASRRRSQQSSLADVRGFIRVFSSSGSLLLFQFLLVLIFIVLHVCLKSHYVVLFSTYVALMLLLMLNATVIACIIAFKCADDTPACITKIYFLSSVLLCLPEHIPVFIWKQCIKICCWNDTMTPFDLFILLKIISLLFIMRAIHLEYCRLKHECQYAMLNEIQGYTVED